MKNGHRKLVRMRTPRANNSGTGLRRHRQECPIGGKRTTNITPREVQTTDDAIARAARKPKLSRMRAVRANSISRIIRGTSSEFAEVVHLNDFVRNLALLHYPWPETGRMTRKANILVRAISDAADLGLLDFEVRDDGTIVIVRPAEGKDL
jgi:hypothetical protein